MSQILPARVVAVDMQYVVIICPICGKFHWHGSGGDITGTNYGTRVPHCTGDDAGRFQGEYELITFEHTTRRKKLLPGDVDAWGDIQRSKRADLEDQWRSRAEAERDDRLWAAVRAIHANGGRLARWQIALLANVAPIHVTRWMNRHGIYYGDGRYQVISTFQAGPELCEIFCKMRRQHDRT
mgnify:CR=1 FL=1